MNKLIDFVVSHSVMVSGDSSSGIEMDLCRVDVIESPDKDAFISLIGINKSGVFCSVDVLNGDEHGYIELGGWIGDQGLALRFMAIGVYLDIFTLLSPSTLMPDAPSELKKNMAQSGLVTIKFKS
jgi:hypothetical protein